MLSANIGDSFPAPGAGRPPFRDGRRSPSISPGCSTRSRALLGLDWIEADVASADARGPRRQSAALPRRWSRSCCGSARSATCAGIEAKLDEMDRQSGAARLVRRSCATACRPSISPASRPCSRRRAGAGAARRESAAQANQRAHRARGRRHARHARLSDGGARTQSATRRWSRPAARRRWRWWAGSRPT